VEGAQKEENINGVGLIYALRARGDAGVKTRTCNLEKRDIIDHLPPLSSIINSGIGEIEAIDFLSINTMKRFLSGHKCPGPGWEI
jgi:hypothetical protein